MEIIDGNLINQKESKFRYEWQVLCAIVNDKIQQKDGFLRRKDENKQCV